MTSCVRAECPCGQWYEKGGDMMEEAFWEEGCIDSQHALSLCHVPGLCQGLTDIVLLNTLKENS
jgi:hypothetical protein